MLVSTENNTTGLASAATVSLAARPNNSGASHPHAPFILPVGPPPGIRPQSVDFYLRPVRVVHPTRLVAVLDADFSIDIISGDATRGLSDTLYLEVHVAVHVNGVGPVQLRATSRVAVPPPRREE